MQPMIKRVQPQDYAFVLALNERNVEFLVPMDAAQLAFFAKTAKVFDVLYADGAPAAFLIALQGRGVDYDLCAYRWFADRYESFLYIDRVVVDEKRRGMGYARKLYRRVLDHAKEEGIGVVAAAIETIPYNEPSHRFHQKMGFYEVGEQTIRGGTVKVSFQIADVPKRMG